MNEKLQAILDRYFVFANGLLAQYVISNETVACALREAYELGKAMASAKSECRGCGMGLDFPGQTWWKDVPGIGDLCDSCHEIREPEFHFLCDGCQEENDS